MSPQDIFQSTWLPRTCFSPHSLAKPDMFQCKTCFSPGHFSPGHVSVQHCSTGHFSPNHSQPRKKQIELHYDLVDPSRCIPHEQLPSVELASIKMSIKGQAGLLLKMYPKNEVFVVNSKDTEVELKQGAILASFGKGKWKEKGSQADKVLRVIEYKLHSPDHVIVHEGSLKTLREVVADKRATNPAAKVY
eukprot:6458180-Amphidinium_carterae.1